MKILTPTGGFLEGYAYSLNPYIGCMFGCAYCYVRKLPVALFRNKPWGSWVEGKREAASRIGKELAAAKRKGPVTIFMSSSTDPYQPAEYKERLTRALLAAMADNPPDFLFVQTRSPLVTRDLDLLRQFGDRILVSITIETDREDVRRAFTPSAPPLAARFRALQAVRDAGIPCQAAVAPVLPFSGRFASRLAACTDRVTVDDYELGDGSGGRRSRQLGLERIYASLNEPDPYSPWRRERLWAQLEQIFSPQALFLSREGFLPPGSSDRPQSR